MGWTVSEVQVVGSLAKSSVLIENWIRFADNLGLEQATLQPIKLQYNAGNLTPYALMKRLLADWIAQNGSEATVRKLGDILIRIGSKDVAGRNIRSKTTKKETKTLWSVEELLNLATGTRIVSGVDRVPTVDGQLTLPIKFRVGREAHNFTGREIELANLKEIFDTHSSQVVLISGVAGIGKTQLAKKFVSLLPDTCIVTWLLGETVDSFKTIVVELLHFLVLPYYDAEGFSPSKIVHRVIRELEKKAKEARWIVVITNVDEIFEELGGVVRTIVTYPNAFVVITSTRQEIHALLPRSELIELSGLKENDALDFVKSALGSEIADSDALDLCRTLQNNPSALQQAVAHIRRQQRMGSDYGIAEFLISPPPPPPPPTNLPSPQSEEKIRLEKIRLEEIRKKE